MMIIISILLIYLTVLNIYFYNKEKKKGLGFEKWSEFFISLFILIFFIIFFIFFIRILGFFRETYAIDLKIIFHSYELFHLIIFLLFFFSLKRLLFLIFKLNFFKMHFFYLAPSNNRFYAEYYYFYINIFYNNAKISYKYLYFVDKILTFLLLFLIFHDLIFNHLILNNSLFFIKYYAFFKFSYIIIRFVSQKQDLLLDYYLFNLYYMDGVRIDEGFFAETLSIRSFDINEYEDNIIKS